MLCMHVWTARRAACVNMTVLNSDRPLSVTAKHKEIYICVCVYFCILYFVLLYRSQKQSRLILTLILIIIVNDIVKGQAFFNQLIIGIYIFFLYLLARFCVCAYARQGAAAGIWSQYTFVYMCVTTHVHLAVFSLCTKSWDHPPFILSTSSLTALILSSLAFFTLALYPFISLSCYHLPTPTVPLS